MSLPFLDLGEGIEVRLLESADAEESFALVDADRERLRRWMPWTDQTHGPGDIQGFIERGGSGRNLDALGIYDSGRLVGAIGARPDEEHGDCEIGYWISGDQEGRGLVSRACRALIDHAFSKLNLHRVTIRVAPDNVRSRAIAERLGFVQEGTMREAGRAANGYHDLVVYGMLRQDWRTSA